MWVIRDLMKNEGFGGFFKGFTPKVLCVPLLSSKEGERRADGSVRDAASWAPSSSSPSRSHNPSSPSSASLCDRLRGFVGWNEVYPGSSLDGSRVDSPLSLRRNRRLLVLVLLSCSLPGRSLALLYLSGLTPTQRRCTSAPPDSRSSLDTLIISLSLSAQIKQPTHRSFTHTPSSPTRSPSSLPHTPPPTASAPSSSSSRNPPQTQSSPSSPPASPPVSPPAPRCGS